MIPGNNTRQIATAIIMAAIIGIVFYAAGYGHASSRAVRREQQLKDRVRAGQEILTAVESRTALLRARIALYQAANDSGAQDAATANARIEQASADLAAVNAQAAGVDPARLNVVVDQLRNFEMQQPKDPQAQNAQIRQLERELGGLITAPAVANAAAGGH